MNCEECSEALARGYCHECEQSLCLSCKESLHKGGNRKSHSWQLLCKCGRQCVFYCDDCCTAACECGFPTQHSLKTSQPVALTGVFWDCCSVPPERPLQECLQLLQTQFKNISLCYVYGHLALPSELPACVQTQASCTIHKVLLDMSIQGPKGFAQLVLVSQQAGEIKPHLLRLTKALPHTRLAVVSSFARLVPLPVEQLRTPEEEDELLLGLLRSLAANGQLIHEINWLTRHFSQVAGCSLSHAVSLVRSGEARGLLHLPRYQLDFFRPHVLVGLRLAQVTAVELRWTLRSLQIDELLPTLPVIQRRVQSAFHCDCASLETVLTASEFSVVRVTDSVSLQRVDAVFLSEAVWQSFNEAAAVSEEELRTLVQFVQQHRLSPVNTYACAQACKLFGPPTLKRCSLGKLCCIVRLAFLSNHAELDNSQESMARPQTKVLAPASSGVRSDNSSLQRVCGSHLS